MFEPSRIKLYLKIGAFICVLAGAGIALLAMAGPLGVWMGFSDFRRGFGFLQIVNAWADWIAIGTLILAVAIAVISKVRSIDNGFRLSGLALIGTLCATLAWLVPESFRPPVLRDEGRRARHPFLELRAHRLDREAPHLGDRGRVGIDGPPAAGRLLPGPIERCHRVRTLSGNPSALLLSRDLDHHRPRIPALLQQFLRRAGGSHRDPRGDILDRGP